MQLSELREFQVDFEKSRLDINSKYKDMFKAVEKFKKDYSAERILSLDLDEYVIGKGRNDSFCNRIENELNAWGNIHGSTAKKFGIYFGVDGKDKERKYRIGKNIFGTTIDEAFLNIKTSIVELLKNENDIELLKKNPISTMYKGKILSIYFPEKFLNIYAAGHLNYFINMLGLENTSKYELDKQLHLLEFKNNDAVMKNWSVFEFGRFLYHSFGRPTDELKEGEISKELSEYKINDFPPIEKIRVEYIDLETATITNIGTTQYKTIKKVDYSAQSKKYKRIGDRGEQIAVMAERKFLIANGKPDLAKKVDQISKRDDSVGYDIKSFDLNNREKFIEVKSTLKPAGICNVFLSSNELHVSQSKDNYYFYIVYDAGSKRPKIWRIKGSDFINDENVDLQPVLYKITLKTK